MNSAQMDLLCSQTTHFRVKSSPLRWRWEQFWFDFRLSVPLGSGWEPVTGFRCVDNALRWEIWMKTGRLGLHCTPATVFVSCFFLFCFLVCWMTSKRSSLGPSRSEPFGICSHYYSLCLCQAEQQRRASERERKTERDEVTGLWKQRYFKGLKPFE